jgi:hypothetical protein
MGRVQIQSAAFWILAGALCWPASAATQGSTPNSPPATGANPAVQKANPSASRATRKAIGKHRRRKVKVVKEVIADPPPQPQPLPPPEPPKPEQMPATPPTVSYLNGQLTIVAPNSTLTDILRAVKSKTGANIEIPAGANERVVGKMGPGAPRDVLAALFNGTHFNYVMLGTANDPNSVAQVVLTPKSGGETPPAMQAGQPGMMQPGMQPGLQPGVVQPFPQAQVQAPAEEPQASDNMEENNSDDTSAQDDSANQDQGAPEQVQGNEAQQNPNQPNVKTPEQLLQELQRQQQIMQQQQQQGQTQQQPPVQQPRVIYTNPQQQPPQQPQ